MKRLNCEDDDFRVEKKCRVGLSLKEFLAKLDEVMTAPCDGFDGGTELQDLMEDIQFDEAEWQKYTLLREDHYTRNLVASKDFVYDLLLLCWQPGQKAAIHDHAESGCWMRVLKGTFTEKRYVAEGKILKETASDDYCSPQTFYINNSQGYHAVMNGPDEVGLTLHLYSPPILDCQVWTSSEKSPFVFKSSIHSLFGVPVPHHMYKKKSAKAEKPDPTKLLEPPPVQEAAKA